MRIVYKDKQYSSIKELANHFNLSAGQASLLLKKGESLEEHDRRKLFYNGRYYKSVKYLASLKGLSPATVHRRIRKGMTMQQALDLGKVGGNIPARDHLGNNYSSLRQMAQAYNINHQTLANRLNAGLDLKECLTTPVKVPGEINCKKSFDHLGNEFISFRALADAYNISQPLLRHRLKSGWSIEKALTEPIKHYGKSRIKKKYKRK